MTDPKGENGDGLGMGSRWGQVSLVTGITCDSCTYSTIQE